MFRVQRFQEEHGTARQAGKNLVKTLMYFEGCPNPFGCTILLRGENGDELKKVKHILPLNTVVLTVALLDKPLNIKWSISTIPGFTAPTNEKPHQASLETQCLLEIHNVSMSEMSSSIISQKSKLDPNASKSTTFLSSVASLKFNARKQISTLVSNGFKPSKESSKNIGCLSNPWLAVAGTGILIQTTSLMYTVLMALAGWFGLLVLQAFKGALHRRSSGLYIYEEYNFYSVPIQLDSVSMLFELDFEWILPGEKNECLKKMEDLKLQLAKSKTGANETRSQEDINYAAKIEMLEAELDANKNLSSALGKAKAKNGAVIKERFKRTKSSLETDLKDICDRYLEMSLKYAEVEAEREDLVM
ncbi:hypothetical protein Tco_1408108 [Tanacetum coccineum]